MLYIDLPSNTFEHILVILLLQHLTQSDLILHFSISSFDNGVPFLGNPQANHIRLGVEPFAATYHLKLSVAGDTVCAYIILRLICKDGAAKSIYCWCVEHGSPPAASESMPIYTPTSSV